MELPPVGAAPTAASRVCSSTWKRKPAGALQSGLSPVFWGQSRCLHCHSSQLPWHSRTSLAWKNCKWCASTFDVKLEAPDPALRQLAVFFGFFTQLRGDLYLQTARRASCGQWGTPGAASRRGGR